MIKKLLKEFKDFAMKGNVIDMAVGVIIGAAFGKVVTAVIDIFLNPIIENITAEQLYEVANEIFDLTRFSTLIFDPEVE